MVVKVPGGYKIKSHKTGKVYPKMYLTSSAAQHRINQMEQFKHMNKSVRWMYVIVNK